MDIEYMGRVLIRLRPFVRDGVIQRTRLERVLAALGQNADTVRPETERLLRKAQIAIEEDQATVAPQPRPFGQPRGTEQGRATTTPVPDGPAAEEGGNDLTTVPAADLTSLAVDAARKRIRADRQLRNPASVLLTAEQEVGLAVLIRGTPGVPLERDGFARLTGEPREAAECLFLHNQGLVHSIAFKYPASGMTSEDIAQFGMLGLIRAVEKFDPARGTKFSTYATWWIRQSITRGIANESRLIRLPVHMVERWSKVWRKQTELTVDGDRPTPYQLALACDLQEKQVLECLRLGPPDLLSLDMKIGDTEAVIADCLDRSSPSTNPFWQVEYRLFQDHLRDLLDTLSDREAGVISMRYGLTDGEEMTLDQIGRVYGVTRERIRQIEKVALERLREHTRGSVLESYLQD